MADAGDVIEVRGGTYRGEHITFMKSGTNVAPIILRAARGAVVIIKGSVVVNSGWVRDKGAIYKHSFDNVLPYFPPSEHLVRGQTLSRNQIFIDGNYIPQIDPTATPHAGSFFVDSAHAALYLQLLDSGNPNSSLHTIEASNTDAPLLTTNGHSYIRIEGLRFEHGANQPQGAALVQVFGGEGCIIDRCVVQYAAGAGLGIGDGRSQTVTGSIFNHNGEEGIAAGRLSNSTFSGNETSYNNTLSDKVFDPFWEAGGNKFARTRSVTVSKHLAHDNNGGGIMFDIDNEDAIITQSTTYKNLWGIVYEISWSGLITNNIVYDNQLGIYLFSSAGCKVYNNTTVGNSEAGIAVRGGEREDGSGHSILPYANNVRNNVVITTAGGKPSINGIQLALEPVPTTKGNTLIPLIPNVSDYNLFYGPSAMPFFRAEGRSATTLLGWQDSSHLDAHSQWADPKFMQALQNKSRPDFRTRSQSLARRAGIALSEVVTDIDDFRRTKSTDIGAYQSH
jgi:parallel beta-helix repeat protein